MSLDIGLVNWLKSWFYDESEVDTLLNAKQDSLVSGTNIKTVNNNSLLGSGNISISTNVTIDDTVTQNSSNPVKSSGIYSALSVKADESDLLDLIYPVGSIYMSVNSTNPSELFGGTWEQIKDRFLLSKGDTYTTNGATGGASTVALTNAQMPRHTHTQNAHNHTQAGHSHGTGNSTNKYFMATNNTTIQSSDSKKQITNGSTNYVVYSTSSDTSIGKYTATDSKTPTINDKTATNKYTGGSGTSESASNGVAHENMPPYLVVNVWKRTA